jgi:hypothetical protein
VEEYTGRKIQPVAVEEILNGKGGTVLWPSFWPVQSIVGGTEAARLGNLQYRDTIADGWLDLLTDEDYIRIDPQLPFQIELLEGYTFPSGQANIRIEYTAGYSPIPADIAQVVTEMVAVAFRESRNGEASLGLSSKNMGQAGASGGTSFVDLTPRWKSVLDRYRSLV